MSERPLSETLTRLAQSTLTYPAPMELRRQLNQQEGSALLKAAVCLLFKGTEFLKSEILLTERSVDLPTHAGHVAFPGGVLEEADANDLARTALRECEEETGVSAASIEVLGLMPEFPTIKGNFEVTPVLALWRAAAREPKLVLSSEVIAAEWVSVEALFNSRKTEFHRIGGVDVESPVFMWGNRRMWGVSAWIFDLICARYGTL